MPGRQAEKRANPQDPNRLAEPAAPGRPRDADVDAAVAAYVCRCAELLPAGSDTDPAYTAGVRHAALELALAAFDHPGLRSAVISRCRRGGIPLPPRGRPGAAALAVEAVLVAVWRFEQGASGRTTVVPLGERWRPLLPEQPTPAQLLVWRERAHVRRINALAPEARRVAILRLARQAQPPRPASSRVRRPVAS